MGSLVATLAVLDAGVSPDARSYSSAPLVGVDMSAAMERRRRSSAVCSPGPCPTPDHPGGGTAEAVQGRGRRARIRRGPARVREQPPSRLGLRAAQGIDARSANGDRCAAGCSCCTARTTRRRTRARPAGSSTRRRARIRSSSPSKAACHLICHETRAWRGVMGRGAVRSTVSSRANGGSTGREWAAEAGSRASAAAGGSAGRGEERQVAPREFRTFGRGRRGSGPGHTVAARAARL